MLIYYDGYIIFSSQVKVDLNTVGRCNTLDVSSSVCIQYHMHVAIYYSLNDTRQMLKTGVADAVVESCLCNLELSEATRSGDQNTLITIAYTHLSMEIKRHQH